eukprot:2251945-Amphidinium_carterae.1
MLGEPVRLIVVDVFTTQKLSFKRLRHAVWLCWLAADPLRFPCPPLGGWLPELPEASIHEWMVKS